MKILEGAPTPSKQVKEFDFILMGGQGLNSVHCGDAEVAYRLFPGT